MFEWGPLIYIEILDIGQNDWCNLVYDESGMIEFTFIYLPVTCLCLFVCKYDMCSVVSKLQTKLRTVVDWYGTLYVLVRIFKQRINII